MKLNCKPNQLCMLIKDIMWEHGGESRVVLRSGFICTTVRLMPQAPLPGEFFFNPEDVGLPAWEIEDKKIITVEFSCGCKFTLQLLSILDAVLRPLPELPDEEEELRLIDLREPV